MHQNKSKKYIISLFVDLSLVFVVLFPFSHAFTSYLDSSSLPFLWLVVHSIVTLLFLAKHNTLNMSLFKGHIWILTLLCFISFSWSVDSSITIRRSIFLFNTGLLALIIFHRFGFIGSLKLLLSFILFVYSISIFLFFLAPSLVTMDYPFDGAFKGVFNHKNYFGRVLCVGIILVLVSYKEKVISIISFWIIFFFFIFGAILTSSFGALVIVTSISFTYLFFEKLNKKGINRLMLIFFTLLLISILALFYVEILALFGKSPTLTGRTLLWALVIVEVFKKPFLGYGFDAFWSGESGASDVIYAVTWEAPHAHNGFLDLWLNLGLLGLVIFVLGFISFFKKSIRTYLNHRDSVSLFAILILVFMLITNLAENQILVENDLMWVIYVFANVAFSSEFKKKNKSSLL